MKFTFNAITVQVEHRGISQKLTVTLDAFSESKSLVNAFSARRRFFISSLEGERKDEGIWTKIEPEEARTYHVG